MITSEDFKNNLIRAAMGIELLKGREDYLLDRIAESNSKEEIERYSLELDKLYYNRYEYLVSETAKRTGGDPERIRDKDARTEAEQIAWNEIAADAYTKEMDRRLKSNYLSALAILYGLEDDRQEEIKVGEYKAFLYYYFATRPNITPFGAGYLDQNPDEAENLIEQYKRFRTFIAENYKESEKKEIISVLEAFAKYDNEPDEAKGIIVRLTEIPQSNSLNLPISKAYREQRYIANEGAQGREVNVGKPTKKGAVIIKAAISDKDGNPLDINGIQIGIQRAIGNLIDKVGGQPALPITVSPQQIYREYAGLPANATVSEQQVKMIMENIEILMYAPSRIDFTQQLEKHTNIKQQSDYDYTSEQAGKLRGPLVSCWIAENVMAHDGTILPIGYIINAYPTYYFYSHIIGQLIPVEKKFLTGSEKPASKESKTADIQGSARNIAIKENVLTRILKMKKKTELIKIDEIADDCGITLTDKIRRTMLKNIGLYLEDLKTQGKITGYSETKKGRKIEGYTVKL